MPTALSLVRETDHTTSLAGVVQFLTSLAELSVFWSALILGPVVRRMISGNLGLNATQGVFLSSFVQEHFLGYFSLFCNTQSPNYRQKELN